MQELRERVITVRLTESEYQNLKSACGSDGDSMSTVVRKTVMERVGANVKTVQKTDQLLREVSQKLERLLGMLSKATHV